MLGKYDLAISQMFLECAGTAKADYLVTGDRAHILPLNRTGNTSILTVSQFLKELGLPENPT